MYGSSRLQNSQLSNKVKGFRPANVLKSNSNTRFPVNFAKFLRTPFSQNTFRWLFLDLIRFGITLPPVKISVGLWKFLSLISFSGTMRQKQWIVKVYGKISYEPSMFSKYFDKVFKIHTMQTTWNVVWDSIAGAFLEFCEIFQNNYSVENIWTTVSLINL